MRRLCVWWVAALLSVVSAQWECPFPWKQYDGSCYRFELYPSDMPSAKLACEENGASLVSVNNAQEHDFISGQLQTLEKQGREWYTSGKKDFSIVGRFFWEGDGNELEGLNFWYELAIRGDKENYRIVYHTDDGIEWLWKLRKDEEELPFICEISMVDVYKIVEVGRGFDYGLAETDPNRLQRGPYFTKQPHDVSYNKDGVDQYAVLECEADGNPNPQYGWFLEKEQTRQRVEPKDDIRYTITNGKLVINEPQDTKDNGDYGCVASNKFGEILSNTVQMSFGYLLDFPKSIRDPVRIEAYKGVGLECNPPKHGYPYILYAWYKDTYMNFIKPKLKPYIFISNNGKLYFSSVTKDDQGDYFCVVSSPGTDYAFSAGKVSMPIPLVIQEAIGSVQEPQIASGFPTVFPSSPKQGDSVRIECFAYGTSLQANELDYTWERIGALMPKTAHMSDHNRVLNIPDIRMIHSGFYKCNVKRRNGQSTSGNVQVPVESAPFFTIPLSNQHVDYGSDLTWRCIGEGVPNIHYKWFRNATELKVEELLSADRQRYTINNNVLSINAVEPKDSGMYQCAAVNSHGMRYSTAQLRVLSLEPSFSKFPLNPNQYGTIKGEVVIICNPEAAPRADIQWLKNKRDLSPSPDPAARLRLLPNGNLRISDVKMGDAGTYTCIASNQHGEAQSSGNLTILDSTTITQAPRNTVVRVNQTAFFHCEASFNPVLDITYDWYQNNRKVDFFWIRTDGSSKVWIEKEPYFDRGTGINKGGLFIHPVQFYHTGKYTCVVKTSDTEIRKDADLQVIGPPSEPAGVDNDPPTATTIRLKWVEAADNGRPITSYIVEGFNVGEGYWRRLKKNIRGDDLKNRNTLITGLSPFSSYKFRVRAENVLGIGAPSDPSSTVETLAAAPVTNPRNVGGGGGKVGELTITWDELPRAEHNGGRVGYVVSWKKKHLIDDEWDNIRLQGSEHSRYVTLVGDKNFYSLYDVRVQSFNEVDDGPDDAPIVTIYSAEDIPVGVPLEVRAYPENSTALLVEWTPVPDTKAAIKGLLLGYRVNYWVDEEEEESMAFFRPIPGQTDKGIILGLYPWTMYRINVQVYNSGGVGPKSQDFVVETLRSAPKEAPQEVHLKPVGWNSIYVEWRGVSTRIDEEPLEGYMVRYYRVGETIYETIDIDAYKKTRITIDGFEPNMLYNLRVMGYSRGGDGLMSSPTKQFILGANCQVREEYPEKEYVQTCGSSSTSIQFSIGLILWTLLWQFAHRL